MQYGVITMSLINYKNILLYFYERKNARITDIFILFNKFYTFDVSNVFNARNNKEVTIKV